MPAWFELGSQLQRNGRSRRSFRYFGGESPLNRIELLGVQPGGANHDCKEELHFATTLDAAVWSSSSSIFSLTLPCANSAATRMAFLMALAFDRPWQMMLTPLTPRSGTPPYSE